MRQLRLEPKEAKYFTLDEFDSRKVYAGLRGVGIGGREICVLTRDRYQDGRYKFLILSPGQITVGNSSCPGREGYRETMREFLAQCYNSSIYEFDTAHEFFTIDEFQDSRTYAGTVEKLGRVYLLTWSDRRDSWDFMVFTDHAATRGINLFGLRNLPASEALRRFAEQYGPVYEFKTAHEFFTWAAEVTA